MDPLVALPTLPSRYGSTPARVRLGVLELLGAAVRDLGLARVMLVTDAGLHATGWPDRAATALRSAGVGVTWWDDVAPNPAEDDVARCAMMAFEAGVDGIVALGGGSVVDTAKGAAFLVRNDGPMERWRGFHLPPEPLLPVVAVPTTAGTGSEVQSFALISRSSDHAKLACGAPGAMPKLALLDPRLTASAPRTVTATSGLDALVHALETSVTSVATPASRQHARHAFELLWQGLPRVLEVPDDLAARELTLLGACMAGQAIEASMLGAAHAAANPLTARFGVPHGVAVGLMAPHVIRFNAHDRGAEVVYRTLARAVGLRTGGAQALADAVERLIAQTGLDPSLVGGWGVDPSAVDELAADAATQWTGTFNPRPVNAEAFAELYRAALAG